MLFVVTGGGGYTGYHIGRKLMEGGHSVRLIDIRPPSQSWESTAPVALYDALPEGFWESFGNSFGNKGEMNFIFTNILDKVALRKAFQGADGIVHTASYGVSGEEQLSPHYDKQEMINLTGTKNALEAAHEEQVKVFVFTSTYNVVFGGEVVVAGDETMPYFPLFKHIDHYSRTKAVAEMLVLSFNGKQFNFKQGTIRTCSLRFNGIMGLGEQRHLNRIVKMIRSGLFCFTFGSKEAVVDFVGIQNVVQAHIRALMQLLDEQIVDNNEIRSDKVSGEAFFISDESPINNFEFFRPLVEGLGYIFPTVTLPFPLIMLFAKFQELIYKQIHRMYPFAPIVTPVEVFKTGRTHYFKCAKARQRFLYQPTRPNDLSQVITSLKKNLTQKKSNVFYSLAYGIIAFFVLFLLFLYNK